MDTLQTQSSGYSGEEEERDRKEGREISTRSENKHESYEPSYVNQHFNCKQSKSTN